MKKLLSVILSIAMLLSMATAVFAEEFAMCEGYPIPTKGTITVGINAEYPPFEYYEGEELKGFDIDLMNYIGERINYDIDYVNMSFDKLIPAVVSGEVDCAISAITITKERESVIDYSIPYLIANVIYKDGEEWLKDKEKYAIVFPSMEKTSIKSSITPEEYLYSQINIAIGELRDDHTIKKLIEKYDLNKPFDDEADANYSYVIPETTVDDVDAEPIDEVDWKEATTVPAPSEWAAKDIDFAYAIGITDINKQYIYKNNITREEFSEVIYNLICNYTQVDLPQVTTVPLGDTSNEKIRSLYCWGIINGKGTFTPEPVVSPEGVVKSYPTLPVIAPNDYLTREEAATIIIRMVDKFFPIAATEIWFEYDDIEEISDWASDSIQTISNLGFMNGVGNNKFAPKDTYTTEQAIATLVRVYEGAEAAGIINHNTSIGIIGSADGPTSIIVGDNVNVIETEEYENFYVNVTENTIEVDDFYIDEAIKLITESGELAADKKLISYYTSDEEITEKISALSTVDWGKPAEIYYMAADREQILANLKALYSDELNFDYESLTEFRFEKLWNKLNFSALASMINASYGSENLAALTILTNNRGYIIPKDFEKNFALFLKYDGDYSAIVSFSEYGEGVISANMSFVKNGDKDNVFRRIYEITQGLGEDSIDVAKVKR